MPQGRGTFPAGNSAFKITDLKYIIGEKQDNMKELIVFIDSGDTLVDESTEVRDENGTVQHCQLFDGAKETVLKLFEAGYTIALVADGKKESFDNIYRQHGLSHCFAVRAISEIVGVEKPSKLIFDDAMSRLSLTERDFGRIVMIGNNIKKDIVGANRLGIISVLMSQSPRYNMHPKSREETPDYVVSEPGELFSLIEFLEMQLKNKKRLGMLQFNS